MWPATRRPRRCSRSPAAMCVWSRRCWATPTSTPCRATPKSWTAVSRTPTAATSSFWTRRKRRRARSSWPHEVPEDHADDDREHERKARIGVDRRANVVGDRLVVGVQRPRLECEQERDDTEEPGHQPGEEVADQRHKITSSRSGPLHYQQRDANPVTRAIG